MGTTFVFRHPNKSGMDDTFDFLNSVGSEYVEIDTENRARCDNCDIFIPENEGGWDTDYENYYCNNCCREFDIEYLDN